MSSILAPPAASSSSAAKALQDRRLRAAALQQSKSYAARSRSPSRRRQSCRPAAVSGDRRETLTQELSEAGQTVDFDPAEQSVEIATQQRRRKALPPLDLDAMGWEAVDAQQFPDPRGADIDQEYVEIPMHGCVAYVAAGEGEQLRLDDIVIQDHESGDIVRATPHGDVPAGSAMYQQIPWVHEVHGDYMNNKETEHQVLRVFFVRWDPDTQMLDFGTVATLDAAGRSISRESIAWPADVQDPTQLTLIIKDGKLELEVTEEMATINQVIFDLDQKKIAEAQAAREEEQDLPVEEPESEADDDDDFDAPDVPAVDFA